MMIDTPASGVIPPASSGAIQSVPFAIAGWALDRSAASGTGVDSISIWASPVGGGPALFAGSGGYGAPRPDLAAFFGTQFFNSGFNTLVSLPNGTPGGLYDF